MAAAGETEYVSKNVLRRFAPASLLIPLIVMFCFLRPPSVSRFLCLSYHDAPSALHCSLLHFLPLSPSINGSLLSSVAPTLLLLLLLFSTCICCESGWAPAGICGYYLKKCFFHSSSPLHVFPATPRLPPFPQFVARSQKATWDLRNVHTPREMRLRPVSISTLHPSRGIAERAHPSDRSTSPRFLHTFFFFCSFNLFFLPLLIVP